MPNITTNHAITYTNLFYPDFCAQCVDGKKSIPPNCQWTGMVVLNETVGPEELKLTVAKKYCTEVGLKKPDNEIIDCEEQQFGRCMETSLVKGQLELPSRQAFPGLSGEQKRQSWRQAGRTRGGNGNKRRVRAGSGGKEKERKDLKTLLSPQLSLITNSSIPQNMIAID